MRSLIALIHREFLEHKGAFLFAPLVLLAIFTVAFGSAAMFTDMQVPIAMLRASTLQVFEIGFLIVGALWMAYLLVALFFYYADAFSADRRNNAMLFWKSMPVSDFQILSSKMLAGMTLFPALIFAAILATGLVLYGMSAIGVSSLPNLTLPGFGETLASALQVAIFAFVHVFLALLWFAPLFAWVGALSTAVGRWSIPLAFLVPGLLVLGENLFLRGMGAILTALVRPTGVPAGGYVLDYLGYRMHFGFEEDDMLRTFVGETQFNAGTALTALFATIDWGQMALGIAVAAVLVWLASEYRRRIIVA